MNIKKNSGVILIMLGIILTLEQTKEFEGIIASIVYYVESYWPLIITFMGIYLLTTPVKSRKK